MLKFIWRFFKPKTNAEIEYDYLARSTDICDFEGRMNRIQRGDAPFQKYLW